MKIKQNYVLPRFEQISTLPQNVILAGSGSAEYSGVKNEEIITGQGIDF